MRVKLLSFGVLRDVLGPEIGELELPESSRVGDLLQILQQKTSNSTMNANIWRTLAVAVNREYSSAATQLREGDEVALLPPVSGGLSAS